MSKIEMIMPKMGESVMECTILKWLKNEGDNISKDDSVVEIATDKVDTEIPSTRSGILSKILKRKNSSKDIFNKGVKKYFSLLSVKEDRRTGLIQVNIEMESPNLAAEVANFIGSEIQSYIQI